MRRFGNYSLRDIVVLLAIGGLFIWSFLPRGASGPEAFLEFAIRIAALVVAVAFHEFAHAFVALQLGDATAKMLGRVSLNPIRHLDLFGSLAFLFIGFGWGKPVPINPYNMRGVSPMVGAAISALAGPASNVLLAFIATLPMRFGIVGTLDPLTAFFIQSLIAVNIALAAFNFLPIPPLDGFSLARLVLPRHISAMLEQYGMFILIALVFLPQIVGMMGYRGADPLSTVLRPLLMLIRDIVFFGM
jgi:Zn-dependent protease